MARKASIRDRLGTALARTGFRRDDYRVSPGLYGVGSPGPESPILVTANYKLSFDALRFSLNSLDAWLLVVDTRGVNVWCAAGKGAFSTAEVVHSVAHTRLKEITQRRTLILPQLCATGVSALEVKSGCGFEVVFGPIQAGDIPAFIKNNHRASDAMRSVTFTTRERAVLIPVELYLLLRPLAIIVVVAFLISGIGQDVFALPAAWQRGLALIQATLVGVLSGSVLLPILLPWLYGRQFWIKGLWPGLVAGLLFCLTADALSGVDKTALFLWIVALSSFQGMNFTGCTPYTSPSGVEHEMRRGIPIQAVISITGLVLWMSAPFLGT